MFKKPNYLYGDGDTYIPYHLGLGKHFVECFRKYADNIAIVNGATTEQVRFSKILQQSMSFSIFLSQLGIKKGDIVAVCSENRADFLPAVVGVWCTGAAVTPVSPNYKKEELLHTISITKPKTVIVSQTAYEKNKVAIKSTRYIKNVIVLSDTAPSAGQWFNDIVSGIDVKYENFAPVDVGPHDLAVIMYSSGTTGLPKGVMLSHYNILVTVCMFADKVDLKVAPLTLNITPWFHVMGLNSALCSLAVGRTVVFIAKFEEKLYYECIQKYKPTYVTMPPPLTVLLSKSELIKNYDLSSIQVIMCGAAPLDQHTIQVVRERLPNIQHIGQGYGMTEATLSICRDSHGSPLGPRPQSVGIVSPGNIIKIVDLETNQPLGPHQRGEICIKGPTIMLGYVGLKNEEYFDKEGFYKTGDIGYYDNDKYLYIVDRLKELIKYKGYQVAPAELEAIILQHSAVKDCGVVGKPDKMAGELPTAFVVLKPGVQVGVEDIRQFVADKVSSSKRLRGGVIFVDAIPKNPSGKILRKELRKMLRNHSKL